MTEPGGDGPSVATALPNVVAANPDRPTETAAAVGPGPVVRTPPERRPVGGPVSRAWREGTLTRAKELESLADWAAQHAAGRPPEPLLEAIDCHLAAAREAALTRRWSADKAALERAMSNLDAAEALLLTLAPPSYLLGRLPGLLNDAARHLLPDDGRRRELERVAQRVGMRERDARPDGAEVPPVQRRLAIVDEERLTIVTAGRAAASAALREQLRVRSFRLVLAVTSVLLTVLAAALAGVGALSPTAIPLCFAPEQAGEAVVVCPTRQSPPFLTTQGAGIQARDVDDAVDDAARPIDVVLVELVGLAAAAVAAAAAIRGIRGSSEPHGLPVAVAVLKLPTGAVTALLGLLLMRGGFVPGLTALDTSAQILAWALVFGYAQQLFTRLVDQQADSVLQGVRGGGHHARGRTAESTA
jgi:hypothetical protein